MTRVLLVRAGALGDLLLLRRSVAALRRAGHSVHLLAPAASGSALVGPGGSEVDGLLPWDRPELAALHSEGGQLPNAVAEDLASHALAVAYTRSRVLAHNLARLIPRVVLQDPAPPPGVHASRWLASPLSDLGLDMDPDPPVADPTPEEKSQAASWRARLPEGFVAVHPGAGSPAKTWPAGRFEALLAALEPERPWLLVVGPADGAAAAGLRRRPGAVVAEHLPARLLGAILSGAGLYVGNDSGISHLAAAWGAPTAALFGPTDPQGWAPVGPCVRVLRSPSGTMQGIAVQEVRETAKALWRGHAPAGARSSTAARSAAPELPCG